MVSSFLLITCDIGKEGVVINQLEKLHNVKDVLRVHGAYDLIARVEGSSTDQVREILSHKIKPLNSIRSTLNLPLRFQN